MCNEKNEGLKFDKGKPMFALVPFSIIASEIEPKLVMNFNEKAVLHQAYECQTEMSYDSFCKLFSSVFKIIEPEKFVTRRLEGLAKVYEFGAKKYRPYSWTEFEPITWEMIRIFSAFFRHFFMYLENREKVDDESGLNHIHHALWNVVQLIYLSGRNENK